MIVESRETRSVRPLEAADAAAPVLMTNPLTSLCVLASARKVGQNTGRCSEIGTNCEFRDKADPRVANTESPNIRYSTQARQRYASLGGGSADFLYGEVFWMGLLNLTNTLDITNHAVQNLASASIRAR